MTSKRVRRPLRRHVITRNDIRGDVWKRERMKCESQQHMEVCFAVAQKGRVHLLQHLWWVKCPLCFACVQKSPRWTQQQVKAPRPLPPSSSRRRAGSSRARLPRLDRRGETSLNIQECGTKCMYNTLMLWMYIYLQQVWQWCTRHGGSWRYEWSSWYYCESRVNLDKPLNYVGITFFPRN